jgi:hypothetical protein
VEGGGGSFVDRGWKVKVCGKIRILHSLVFAGEERKKEQ